MFPQLTSDGRVMVPIVPSRIETSIGWIMADGMRELKPGEPNYEETLEWLWLIKERGDVANLDVPK